LIYTVQQSGQTTAGIQYQQILYMITTVISLLASIKLAMDAKSCMCTRRHLELWYGINRSKGLAR
jgi:hypothetical protein